MKTLLLIAAIVYIGSRNIACWEAMPGWNEPYSEACSLVSEDGRGVIVGRTWTNTFVLEIKP